MSELSSKSIIKTRKRTSTRISDLMKGVKKLPLSPCGQSNIRNNASKSEQDELNKEPFSFTPSIPHDQSKMLRDSAYGLSVDEFMDVCFNKKYSITLNVSPKRKNEEALYTSAKWTTDELRDFQELKKCLNRVKDKLDHYNLDDWHKHTKNTNPANLVMQRLRSEVKVEFLTQAWCKFYEIISEYHLIPKDARRSNTFYSMHLCEAPGAFVASLNHYLKLNHPNLKWQWKATSLNPYYEGNTLSQMINDDRFIKQTIGQWYFGPDMTGDITHPDYADHLRRECGDQLAHLVTADGSIDCQNRPGEQENIVSWLHLKETLTALRVLRKGGHFVIKMFTFFECDTICLLYFLCKVFECIHVMKPATSKEGNSEVYVICKEYRGGIYAGPYLAELLLITEEQHKNFAMFPYHEICRQFMTSIFECAKKFADYQMSVIERNIKLFPDRDDEELRRQFAYMQEKVWRRFVNTYYVKPIPSCENIVCLRSRQYEIRRRTNYVIERRERNQGSHYDQLQRKNLSKGDIFGKISTEFDDFHLQSQRKVWNTHMPNVIIPTRVFNVVRSKPIKTVMSSQFCNGTLMRWRNEKKESVTAMCSAPKKITDYEGIRICDFREIFFMKENYSDAAIIAFHKIYNMLDEMSNGDDLLFIYFPSLTLFNINILCFLKQIFHVIRFEDAKTLSLSNLNVEKLSEWGPYLDELLRSYYSKGRVVHRFLPLETVFGVRNPLYHWLLEVNNARIDYEISLMIDTSRGLL